MYLNVAFFIFSHCSVNIKGSKHHKTGFFKSAVSLLEYLLDELGLLLVLLFTYLF